jgi:hypothetical protein
VQLRRILVTTAVAIAVGGLAGAIRIPATAAPAPQTITFAALPNHHYGTGPYTLDASASSGLPVSFSAEDGSACTVAGSTLTLTKGGPCTVDADQPGNDDWDAAPTVSRPFTVLKAVPVLQVSPADQHPQFGVEKVLVSVLATAPLTPTGSVTLTNQVDDRSCTVANLSASGTGSCPVLLRPGTVRVEAHYLGDANYKAWRGHTAVRVRRFTPRVTLSTSIGTAPGGPRQTLHTHVRVHRTARTAPTGTVSVTDHKGEHCKIHLHDGAGTCSIVAGNGSYTTTARYSGDVNYAEASTAKHIHLG